MMMFRILTAMMIVGILIISDRRTVVGLTVHDDYSNVRVPRITLGTGGFNVSQAETAVANALAIGFSSVHVAFDYYNLEGVGRSIAGYLKNNSRSSLFVTAMTSPCVHVTSKPVRNVTDEKKCFELTKKEIDITLDKLGIEYADLLLLHGPSEPFGYQGRCDDRVNALNRAQWRAYQSKVREGRALAIGVSNFCESCLDGLGDPKPLVNQIQLHVGTYGQTRDLLDYCRKRGILVQAYSPLAAGEVATDSLCSAVGQKYNRTAAEVGLRWVLRQSGVVVVVKASDPKYLKQDLEALTWDMRDSDASLLNNATEPKGQQDGRPSWGCGR